MGKISDLIQTAIKYEGDNYKHFCNAFAISCFAWCAAFVSVCGKESGNGDIIPWSTSCNDQISWFKNHDMWIGKTANIKVGDIIYYDWDKLGDSRPADHVGIVVAVSGNSFTVIEGNKGDYSNDKTKVGTRTITKDYKYIYGFARPKYDDEQTEVITSKDVTITVKQLSLGSEGTAVKTLQNLLVINGYSVGDCGCDGDFGADTAKALKLFQRTNNLEADGICGQQTWSKILS